MCYEMKIETGITIVAVVVAIVSVYVSNKSSKRQILVPKLEELYEVICSLSRYYGRFMNLNAKVEELRDSEYKELQTLSQYYQIRDQEIEEDERRKVKNYLSRIEVLAECYTKGDLKKKILDYEDMMYSFSDFVFKAGSIHQELKYKNGFPEDEDFNSLITKLKKELISKIRL